MARVIRLTAELRAEFVRLQEVRAEQERRRQREIDALVVEHLDLVQQIARHVRRMYTRAGQNGYSLQIDLEELVACGYVGLVQAARRYDPAAGAFPGFARRRIQGAMIDAHRRGAYRDMQHASLQAAESSLREDSEDSTGKAVAIALAGRDRAPLPDEAMAQKQVEDLAMKAIRTLPEDERVVIIDALRGAALAETAAARGRSVAWARAKLASARDKVAALVQQDQRAA